jgi:hypothetical protein
MIKFVANKIEIMILLWYNLKHKGAFGGFFNAHIFSQSF